MSAPVTYRPGIFGHITSVDDLWDTIPWENREGAPRYEAWMNDYCLPYTYGRGENARTYEAMSDWPMVADGVRGVLNSSFGLSFDCCFINGYAHQRQHLGWHADDSPEMDHEHPIAVVSFGAEREIWFRKTSLIHVPGSISGGIHQQLLGNGSLLLMHAGMQREWQHRIPKADREVGKRVSLTFRRLVR